MHEWLLEDLWELYQLSYLLGAREKGVVCQFSKQDIHTPQETRNNLAKINL